MSNSTFFLKIITETNKKFILTIENSTTMNMLIKIIKKYYAFYFKKKYFIEYILTEDKYIILDNHLVNKFFTNGNVCVIKGKETEDIEQDCFIENKIKYDVFVRKRNKEQINDGENKKIKQNEESSFNKNTRNYNIKSGINPKLVIKKNIISEKKISSSDTSLISEKESARNLDKLNKYDSQNVEIDKLNKMQNKKIETNKISSSANFFNKCNLENNISNKNNFKSNENTSKNNFKEEFKEQNVKLNLKSNSFDLQENIKKCTETNELFVTETINNNFNSIKQEITNLKKIKKQNKINYDDL